MRNNETFMMQDPYDQIHALLHLNSCGCCVVTRCWSCQSEWQCRVDTDTKDSWQCVKVTLVSNQAQATPLSSYCCKCYASYLYQQNICIKYNFSVHSELVLASMSLQNLDLNYDTRLNHLCYIYMRHVTKHF